MDVTEARRDVDQTAVVLDQFFPGWDQRVNLERFSLYHPSQCVLYYANGMKTGAYTMAQWKLKRAGVILPVAVFAADDWYGQHWRDLIWARQNSEEAEFNRLCKEEAAKIKREERAFQLTVGSMLIVSAIMAFLT